MRRPRDRVHYAWIVAMVTFLTMLISAGIRSTPGVLMIPLAQSFGWTRETVSLAVAIRLLLFGLIGPFSAAMMDRFGVRRTTAVALACLGVGMGATVWMRAAWQLDLLWGVVVGCGAGFTATVLGVTVAARWFQQQRGLVVGLLTASNASGTLLFLPLMAALTSSFGWRVASLATCAAALLLVPLVLVLLRDRPGDKGLMPYGATVPAPLPSPARPAGNLFVEPVRVLALAVRSRDFWLLTGSFLICGLSTSGLITNHLIPALMDHGYSEVHAAGLLALLGVFDIIGTTTSGWLTDRFDSRWLLVWYYGLRGLALLYLPVAIATSPTALTGFIVFYGLDWVATVPPTVRLSYRSFGEDSPVVYGWVFAAHQFGAAVAAFGAGLLYTEVHHYSPAFWAAGGLCLLAALLVTRIERARSAGGGGGRTGRLRRSVVQSPALGAAAGE